MSETNRSAIDPDVLTDAQGAKELESHAMRKALSYNAYGKQMEFDVVVLTKPVPMASSDAKAVFSESPTPVTQGNLGAAGVFGAPGQLEGAIAFRGRIIGNGFISPHASLPDPCNLDMASSAGTAIKIINLHTQFMSVPGYSGRIPSLGDTVKVKLMAGDIDKNLQYAIFSELAQATGESVAANLANSCQSLVSKFSTFDPDVDFDTLGLAYSDFSSEGSSSRGISRADAQPYLEAIMAKIRADPNGTLGYTALSTGQCGYPPDFPGVSDALKEKYPVTTCKSVKLGVNLNGKEVTVTGHPAFIDTLQNIFAAAKRESWWREETSRNGINPILTSGGYRSIETQAYLRMKNCGHRTYEQVASSGAGSSCKPPTAKIGFSRHNLGLAIDFGGLIGSDGNSKSHKWLESKGLDGDGTFDIKNFQKEDWHWSSDGF